ncbi:hypothetical protein HU200_031689 [Digitaria exilis]|uniref:Leucine-rich repeat-containing N-terminal plant-type domain-containing protein n=1 Tax=Digitaria exilis TaxID=1010633 RepID=A0A835EPS9_9POAL|nr:hypothetical protein HU200_031689 [Digitaria exilis]
MRISIAGKMTLAAPKPQPPNLLAVQGEVANASTQRPAGLRGLIYLPHVLTAMPLANSIAFVLPLHPIRGEVAKRRRAPAPASNRLPPSRFSRLPPPTLPVLRIREMAVPAPPRAARRLAALCFVVASCAAALAAPRAGASRPSREDLDVSLGSGGGVGVGIGIGGGGQGGGGGSSSSSPAPPSPSGPRPCDFENERLYRAYLVIQQFKESVTCDPMDITRSWSGTDLCSTYKGFFCQRPPNVSDRTIASVDFNGYMLRLPDLALFHANSNDFGGAVPALAGLQYFYELDLSNNRLAPAPFPTDVLGLTNATFIDLRFNSFYGELPVGVFCRFPRIQAIFDNNNQFSGSLPDNIGQSPVNYLSLANNRFTGEIPKSIARNAGTLLEVLFLNNSLSGCLPYELGLLEKATVIDAGTNRLTGTIPASFACLRKVEQLNLADNLLYGEVPDALCRLGFDRLRNLTLSGNYFTSLGSCCWDLIKQGRLNVDRNCIQWAPNQRSHEECAKFLQLPKSCPVSNYLPCSSKYHGSGGEPEEDDAAVEYRGRTRRNDLAGVEKGAERCASRDRETTDQAKARERAAVPRVSDVEGSNVNVAGAGGVATQAILSYEPFDGEGIECTARISQPQQSPPDAGYKHEQRTSAGRHPATVASISLCIVLPSRCHPHPSHLVAAVLCPQRETMVVAVIIPTDTVAAHSFHDAQEVTHVAAMTTSDRKISDTTPTLTTAASSRMEHHPYEVRLHSAASMSTALTSIRACVSTTGFCFIWASILYAPSLASFLFQATPSTATWETGASRRGARATTYRASLSGLRGSKRRKWSSVWIITELYRIVTVAAPQMRRTNQPPQLGQNLAWKMNYA